MIQIISTECGNIRLEVSRRVSLVKDYPKQLPDDTYKIYWVCEPRAMLSACGNLDNSAIKSVASNFDAILTYDDELLALPNAHSFVYGTCWLKDNMSGADYEYRDKKFQRSHLVGGKNAAEGHGIRHYIYDNQLSIENPIDFYISRRLPRANTFSSKLIGEFKYDLFDSEYHLAIENSRQKNYFTEKVIDCFYAKTIPIYYGCPNIEDYFDTDGMIIVESKEEAIEACNSVTKDLYMSKIEHIEKNYELCQQYVNIIPRLEKKIMELVK